MATIVNNPPATDSGSGGSMLLGIVLFVVLAILFVVYALPAISRTAAPQVSIPDRVDVNVNQQP